jgi:hypothetical protein
MQAPVAPQTVPSGQKELDEHGGGAPHPVVHDPKAYAVAAIKKKRPLPKRGTGENILGSGLFATAAACDNDNDCCSRDCTSPKTGPR